VRPARAPPPLPRTRGSRTGCPSHRARLHAGAWDERGARGCGVGQLTLAAGCRAASWRCRWTTRWPARRSTTRWRSWASTPPGAAPLPAPVQRLVPSRNRNEPAPGLAWASPPPAPACRRPAKPRGERHRRHQLHRLQCWRPCNAALQRMQRRPCSEQPASAARAPPSKAGFRPRCAAAGCCSRESARAKPSGTYGAASQPRLRRARPAGAVPGGLSRVGQVEGRRRRGRAIGPPCICV